MSTRLAGLLAVLEGWKYTLPGQVSYQETLEREKFFHQWSLDAQVFFADLKAEPLYCTFNVGDSEVRAHCLRPLGDEFALYDGIGLFPGNVYVLDYANMHHVPAEAMYDLPLGRYSDINQLYLGDIRKEAAVSLNQLTSSLLENGGLKLIPKVF